METKGRTCVSFTLSLCELTSYLLVLTLPYWLPSITSCHTFFCLTEELSIVCSAVPLVLFHCDFPISIIQCWACFYIMRYSCAVSCVVLATQYWPICKAMFVWRGQNKKKKKRKITLSCGPWGAPSMPISSWQAWCACPDLILWRASSS